jgi:hypothetical protein
MAPPRTVDLPIDLGFVIPRLAAGIVVGASHWEWVGRKSKDGYGVMLVPAGPYKQRTERVHRLVYRIFVGPIGPFPLHHDVDLCHLPACCNPAHLEPLTDEEHGLAHRSGKCSKGHDLIGNNLMLKPDGRPRCRRCAYERDNLASRAKSSFHRGEHKTHCKYGHLWIPENIYTKPSTGHRECRLCIKDRTARLRSG